MQVSPSDTTDRDHHDLLAVDHVSAHYDPASFHMAWGFMKKAARGRLMRWKNSEGCRGVSIIILIPTSSGNALLDAKQSS